ncbi:MAG: serine/threonine protein kinase [Myxococcales bacterium]|nr:serine/threonine protein kinase [Myxococcales bacterium]
MPPHPRVGTLFGEWRIEECLGDGVVWSTYRARRFGERSVLRILSHDAAKNAGARDRFLEVRGVVERVGHAGPVQVRETGESKDGEPFVHFEFVPGHTLASALREASVQLPAGVRSIERRPPTPPKMDAERALTVIDEVLDCLAAAHERGVLHRDVRLETIFLASEGGVKIGNLGMVRILDAAKVFVRGAPAFLAPEQAMGLVDQLDARADLFGVGAVLHTLVTGQPLHPGETEIEALVAAATKPANPVSRLGYGVPGAVSDIIERSLEWDRRNRYEDAREMQSAIRNALVAVSGERATDV